MLGEKRVVSRSPIYLQDSSSKTLLGSTMQFASPRNQDWNNGSVSLDGHGNAQENENGYLDLFMIMKGEKWS